MRKCKLASCPRVVQGTLCLRSSIENGADYSARVLICYFQYSDFWRAQGDGNCCLWQRTGTQRKECLSMHGSYTAQANDTVMGERKTPLSFSLDAVEEEWECPAHSSAPLLSAHLAKLTWGQQKSSKFHALAFQWPWNQNTAQTVGAEERGAYISKWCFRVVETTVITLYLILY